MKQRVSVVKSLDRCHMHTREERFEQSNSLLMAGEAAVNEASIRHETIQAGTSQKL